MKANRSPNGRTPPSGGRDIRQEFISKALEILEDPDEDRSKLTARALVSAAGRSLGSLAFQFDKGGLKEVRVEVAAIGRARLHDAVRSEQVPGRPPLEMLRGMASAYARFATEHPRLFRLMQDERTKALDEGGLSFRRLLQEQVMRCQVTRAMRLVDPDQATRLVYGVLLGVVHAALDGEVAPDQAPDAAAGAIDELLKGLGPETSAPTATTR